MATLFRMQKALGSQLHILHMSTPEGLAMLRRAKDEGRPCSCEVNPWAMFLGTWENVEKTRALLFGFLGAAGACRRAVGRDQRRHHRRDRHRPRAAHQG